MEVSELKTYYFISDGAVKAVDGVNFHVKEGETLGLIGESGCGKSTVAFSIMRLIPDPPGKIVGGQILFDGEDLLKKSEIEMRNIRGAKIAMGYQDSMTYLNPVMRVGQQISEAIIKHQTVTKTEATEKAIQALKQVGIPSPTKIAISYPHELSGGMRQRAMIAMALSCRPRLLIIDEPTTALDVIIQKQIVDLLKEIQKNLRTSILLITHDIGLVAELCDRMVVMYAGKIVESGDVYTTLSDPLHPYTQGLLESIPTIRGDKRKLKSIPGVVPDLLNPPSGCRFHPRCSLATKECIEREPTLIEAKGRFVSCHARAREKVVFR